MEEIKALSKAELKQVVKEAIKEWLDEKILQFGKWALATGAAFILAGLTYLSFKASGWKPPHN